MFNFAPPGRILVNPACEASKTSPGGSAVRHRVRVILWMRFWDEVNSDGAREKSGAKELQKNFKRSKTSAGLLCCGNQVCGHCNQLFWFDRFGHVILKTCQNRLQSVLPARITC